jgi:transcriptional regulator with XRE-family HTH domain
MCPWQPVDVMQVASTGRRATDVAGGRSPVLRRRELGALLRSLRTEREMTVEQVAESLLCSPSKVSRLETGHRGASPRDIRDLCDLYQLDQAQREHLGRLATEGRGHGWWQPYGLPYETFVGLEAEAKRIRDYAPGLIPGLLQAPDYTRAIHEAAVPQLAPDVIEQRMEARLARQAVLTREEPSPPRFEAIIDEAVLHRRVGGPAVMSAQIDRLVEACELPNVTVQVLPFDAGAHPALDSTFILIEFEDPVPGVVYVDGLVGNLYLERAQDVQRYGKIFERLRGTSLDEQKSLDLMSRMSAAYKKS